VQLHVCSPLYTLVAHTVTTFPSVRQIFELCHIFTKSCLHFRAELKKKWCNRNKHSRQPEARCTSCGYFRETDRHYIYTSLPHLLVVRPCRNMMWLTRQLESLQFQSTKVIGYVPCTAASLTGLEVSALQQQTSS